MSAVAHRVALVQAGQGMRWNHTHGKAWGITRVCQLLHRLAPQTPVLVVDGTDVLVANPLSWRAMRLAREIGKSARRMLFATECNLWPRCSLRAAFATDAQHQQCSASWPTCFLNSGGYLASSAAAMEFSQLILDRLSMEVTVSDQLAAQWAYLRQLQFNLSIAIDGAAIFMASLAKCTKNTVHRPCSRHSWRPLDHLRIDQAGDATLSWSGPHWNPRAETTASNATVQRPFLLHSNADPYLQIVGSRALQPLWNQFDMNVLGSESIAVLDSATFGLCSLRSLSQVQEQGQRLHYLDGTSRRQGLSVCGSNHKPCT